MRNKLYAITGGIGSGKSTATLALKLAGYNTISCDEIVRILYTKRTILRAIKRVFPTAVTGKYFLTVDKKEIARLAFSDKESYDKLTLLITHKTMQHALRKAKRLKGIVFIEVPLLYEFGYQGFFDGVIVITRAIEDRLKSVMARSNMTEEEFYSRVTTQINYAKYDFKNAIVIKNDNTPNDLTDKVLEIAKTL